MADLDVLLYDDEPTSNMAEVADALEEGFGEEWDIALIKRYLLTEEQRKQLYDVNLEVSDLLNRRVEHHLQPDGTYKPVLDYAAIFTAWNEKLGRRVFGSY